MNFKQVWEFTKDTIKCYSEDNIPKHAASLTYYTIFSIAPIILIVITVAGIFFGREAIQGRITGSLSRFVKPETASLIESVVKNTSEMGTGIFAIVFGVVVLIIGATTVFMDMQDSLNTIWRVKQNPNSGIWDLVKSRLIAFVIVIGAGVLLLLSFLITSLIPVLQDLITQFIPVPQFLLNLLGYIISFAVVFVMFLMIFKVLPDVELKTHDVVIGTFVTTVLFVLGQFLIGLYLNSASVGEQFGPAGALIAFLVWVYYTSQVIYTGAEITYNYAIKYGSGLVPSKHAVSVDDSAEE